MMDCEKIQCVPTFKSGPLLIFRRATGLPCDPLGKGFLAIFGPGKDKNLKDFSLEEAITEIALVETDSTET